MQNALSSVQPETSLWRAASPLVLASQSMARRALLAGAGIPLDIHPADIDERAFEAQHVKDTPGAVAALLAQEKARAVSTVYPGRIVVGADQVLALGSQRFSKAADKEGARAQLRLLRGRTHVLHAAVAVVRDGETLFAHEDVARLTMRDFSDSFLDAYLATAGETLTANVGAYALEAQGVQLFSRINGDYFTILGLPLLPLLDFLRRAGLLQT